MQLIFVKSQCEDLGVVLIIEANECTPVMVSVVALLFFMKIRNCSCFFFFFSFLKSSMFKVVLMVKVQVKVVGEVTDSITVVRVGMGVIVNTF